jgi:TolA-binding protein
MRYKKLIGTAIITGFLSIYGFSTPSFAQGGLQQAPLQPVRDPQAEKDANHNLEVAKFYLKRKAYRAVSDRLLEITYVYDQFSRIDEVYFLLGEAFAKQNNKDESTKFYKKLVTNFPESLFTKEVKKKFPELASNETAPNNQ